MEHPYGALSLLPPLAAIVLAMTTRRVVLSLLAGVFVGALILAGGNPVVALSQTMEYHLWQTLIEPDNLAMFAFTTVMAGMSGIIQSNGAMQSLVASSMRFTSTRRRGMLLTWCLGMVIFFDDYANTILLGQTMRPVADRLRISREKLAYLVDCTSAPVAGLALVSTWIAAEITYLEDGLDAVGWKENLTGVEAFIESIPYRFYVLLTLFLALVVCIWNRDFWPMSVAERRARREPAPATGAEGDGLAFPPEDGRSRARWYHAIVPIAITVAAILYQMAVTGRAACLEKGLELTTMNVFGHSDSYRSLLWGAIVGLAVAWLWTWLARLMPWDRIAAAAGEGALMTLPALTTLWFAASISNMTKDEPMEPVGGFPVAVVAPSDASSETPPIEASKTDDAFPHATHTLYAGRYLESVMNWIVGGAEHADRATWALPTIVFVAAAGMSFATGTAWGTMALLMPLALTLCAAASGGSFEVSESTVLFAVIGSVLAGSIWGDHCSPISDTAILSSQSTGCDHLAHVRTQMPYAICGGILSILLGTLPVGFGVSPYLCLLLGAIGALMALRLFGQRTDVSDDPPAE